MFDDTFIDNEAKLRVDLVRTGPRDNRGPTESYRGKLQFPGTLNLERGLCSMVFMSKEGREELQLSGIVPHKRSQDITPSRGITASNELIVRLNPFTDRTDRRGYVGEIEAPTIRLNAERGIEFTVNVPTAPNQRGEMLVGQLHSYEDEVDEDASLRVDLFRARDARKLPFFRGKLQFPGTLDWELGARLKVITTRQCEELRINIMGSPESSTQNNRDRGAVGHHRRLYAPLYRVAGGAYQADLDHPGKVDLDRGLYFTIFTNEGREEIQIARIDPAQVRARQSRRWDTAANG